MLEIKNLSISYDDQSILKNINLKLEPGNVYGLIGINGCGKTSILNAIAQFIAYTGDIFIDNKSIKAYKRKELAKKVAFMRQSTNINFSYTVEEIVNMSQYSNNFDKTNKDIIEEVFEVCELQEIKDKNILNISGGQKQRVFFAKTMAQDSDIMLIDEGFSNIDVYYQVKFMSYLHELAKKKNKTIVIVIHDMNLTLKTIDNVVVFNDGNIYDSGKTQQVITKQMMNDVFNVDTEILPYGINYIKHGDIETY